MTIGALDQRVTVQKPRYERDGAGDSRIVGYDDVPPDRWAEVTPLSGSEGEEASQLVGRQTHQVRIRYLEGLTPQHRLQHRGRFLEISAINGASPRSEFMTLTCTETKDQAP